MNIGEMSGNIFNILHIDLAIPHVRRNRGDTLIVTFHVTIIVGEK
jgi:hypothetical protein